MTADMALLALAFAALGGGAGWIARGRWRGLSPAGPDAVAPLTFEAVIRFPAAMIAAPVVGFGLEVQGILASDYEGSPGDGTDPATGLPDAER